MVKENKKAFEKCSFLIFLILSLNLKLGLFFQTLRLILCVIAL